MIFFSCGTKTDVLQNVQAARFSIQSLKGIVHKKKKITIYSVIMNLF